MADNDNRDLMWIYQFEQPQQCCNRCIEGTHRYVLGAFKKYPPDPKNKKENKKVLICIGLNPNTGIPGRLEDTVQTINDFAFYNEIKAEERNKIQPWPSDGWIMLNLSPIRCSNPDSLPPTLDEMNKTAHERNIEIIKSILEKYPDAVRLAAWGTGITKRSYLKDTFDEFIEEEKRKKRKWYCCCPTSKKDRNNGLTGEGHPYHPRIWGQQLNDAELHEFKIIDYEP